MIRRLIPIITILLFSAASPCFPKQPLITDGILDLANWDFEKLGSISLKGMCEFYWNNLLDPARHQNNQNEYNQKLQGFSGYSYIPKPWNYQLINGQAFPVDGYATYRFMIKLPGKHQPLGFLFNRTHTAYEFYVNGKLVSSAGKVGKTRSLSAPDYFPHIAVVNTDEPALEVIIHISNYFHLNSGAYYPIYLGNASSLTEDHENRLLFDILIFGCLMISGIYTFVLFMCNRPEKVFLYFSFFCLIVAFRAISSYELYMFSLFRKLPWEILKKIESLSLFLPLPVFIMFCRELFPGELKAWIKKVVQVVGFGVSSIALFTPIKFYGHLVKPYQAFILLFFIYALVVILIASIKKRPYALILLLNTAFLLFTILNDTLYEMSLIESIFLSHFGFIVFDICLSIILSMHFARIQSLPIIPRRSEGMDARKIEFTTFYTLTRREKEILELILDGYCAKDIAGILKIAVKTVDNHTNKLYQKINVHSRVEILSKFQQFCLPRIMSN